MRRLVTDKDTIETIIRRASVCRVGMSDDGQPYVVPVCFGYEDGVLYFHSSSQGRKLDILRRNNAVCVEFDVDQETVRDENPCKWGVRYRSVIGFGRAYFVKDPDEKCRALNAIMTHSGGNPGSYPESTLQKTVIVRIEMQNATAKVSGY